MNYRVCFQYLAPGAARPDDACQYEEIAYDGGEYTPLPAVGDSVSYREGSGRVARLVLTRHFSYAGGWCYVTIVVTDLPAGEMERRRSE